MDEAHGRTILPYEGGVSFIRVGVIYVVYEVCELGLRCVLASLVGIG